MEKRVLLVGEPMGLFIANETGRLEDVNEFSLTTCGAEFNVAVGLTRLHKPVTYLTKLGDDPFGKRIVNVMNQVGISTGQILFSDSLPTGFMLKEKVDHGDPGIFYFRKGSAASSLSKQDVEGLDFRQYGIVHLTGITPALSESCREMAETLNKKAREDGCLFSFDPNLRPQLWPSTSAMTEYINKMAAKSDVFLPGINEAKILIGEDRPEEVARRYMEMGTQTVIVKLGAQGAYYADCRGNTGYVDGFPVSQVVDTVGAGDGFAAGVLSELLDGKPLEQAVKIGCAIGAIQVMSRGDNDGLPDIEELDAFIKGRPDWRKPND